MTQRKIKFLTTKPNLLIGLSAAILATTVGIKYFIEYYVFPAVGNLIVIDVPARSGGTTYYVDPSEFQVFSIVAIAIAAALTVLVIFLAKTNNLKGLTIAMLANFTFALLYFPLMIANTFHALWEGYWSVLGAAIGVIIVFALEYIFFKSLQRGSVDAASNL